MDAYNVGQGDVTFEAWIRPGSNLSSTMGKPTILSKGANFKVWISSGIVDAWLTTSLDPDTDLQDHWLPLKNNECQHVVIVRDSRAGKLFYYLNGELKKEIVLSSMVNINSRDKVGIGTDLHALQNPDPNYNGNWLWYVALVHDYDGQLNDVRLWSRALSRTEVNESRSGAVNVSDQALLGYWPLKSEKGILYHLSQQELNAFNLY